jgi:hypothetical protein
MGWRSEGHAVTESPNSTRWTHVSEESGDGVMTYVLSSWASFFNFLETEVFHVSIKSKRAYIWRGQRRADWSISSSLDRLIQRLNLLGAGPEALDRLSEKHLGSFAFAARGRRGLNPRKLDLKADANEWWALGQHFGLATPLVDWTRSPFAAAYFAFEEVGPGQTEQRVVYGLDRLAVERSNDALGELPLEGRMPTIEFVEPMSDENQRLVSQSGLFTRTPILNPVDRWVPEAFRGSRAPVLLRIKIPDADRLSCLGGLDRMNINHLSLFPDLAGASRSTNLKLEIEPRD